MDPLTIFAALAAGAAIGAVLGLVGGGGSILAVPLLVYFVGVDSPHAAIGTAAVAVALNAAASLAGHARSGNVKWPCALVFAGAGVIGALLGAEAGKAMDGARRWAVCRIGYVETARALGMREDKTAVDRFHVEWPSFSVVEVDLPVAEDAAGLAVATGLRALDAIHLSAALALPGREVTFATWDKRLHRAGRERGLTLLPDSLPA